METEKQWSKMTMTLTRSDGQVGTIHVSFDTDAGKMRIDRMNTEFPEQDDFALWDPSLTMNYLTRAMGDAVVKLMPEPFRMQYFDRILDTVIADFAAANADAN